MEEMHNAWQELYLKYLDGKCNEEELQLLLDHFEENGQDSPLADTIRRVLEQNQEEDIPAIHLRTKRIINDTDLVIKKIVREDDEEIPVKQIGKYRFIAAAAVIFMLAFGAYVFYQQRSTPDLADTAQSAAIYDVAPGGNKAVLTLADGSQVVLDSIKNGTLAEQEGTIVSKTEDGQLTYRPADHAGVKVQYNSITTPKGGEYKLTLSDGTKIWLNANSTLKYPTSFTAATRQVQMTGEIYFEVAHDKKKPFHVQIGDMDVEVLGTHFNIQAYEDEKEIRTTLVEGAVKVKSSEQSALLKPGQQIVYNAANNHLTNPAKVNLEEVTAWKEGYFLFNQSSLQDVLQQIMRWYDIEIKYLGEIPNRKFSGGMSRHSNLSDVLKILKESGIQFKLKGNTLMVAP